MARHYKVGDELRIWITGLVGDYRVKIIRLDTRYGPAAAGSQQFVLEVLDPETGEQDSAWVAKLKPGDYIIKGPWEEA